MTTIVMTGGTSGLGEIAAKRLASSPATRLLLGAREAGPQGVDTLTLDMVRLENVRSFALAVNEWLGGAEIDALVLNAGMSLPNVQSRTADGFETTFAVNHLAHYYLLRLLLPRLVHGAIIVITTSGAHDPAERTPIPPPRHADVRLLAYPELDPDRDQRPRIAGGRAYSSSKLCNVLTARALAADPEAQARRLSIIAYNPGPVPGTRLVRESGFAINFIWQTIGPVLVPLVPNLNSRQAAGIALADLALGKTRPPAGRIYASLRRERLTWPDPSEMARRDDLMEALWHDSAALVGMKG
ncbi:MAG: SDR family NAD(P)-dependent oxidoreductase [Acidobacteria bacterium]|nr:SDR family NAD(P)-dependent oxidoreductase [Acidobacteriota bacterium]